MTEEGPKLLGEITEERHVLSELVSWKERAVRHPPQSSFWSPNEGTSVGEQLWEHGERAIVEKPVTSALNARSWQSGCINKGMTPERCHAIHCNSQQVEGSAGWDRHSSGDLHNRQMDGQDEGSRRIYNQKDLTNKEGQFGRHEKALLVEYQRRRRRTHPRTRHEDGLWPSPQLWRWRSCSPTILSDRWRSSRKGPVLKPASLPNSLYWACWVWVRSHIQWKTPSKSGPYNMSYKINIVKTTNRCVVCGSLNLSTLMYCYFLSI